MKKYRIIKVTRNKYFFNNEEYVVQKRFLGFLWWWNFLNIDAGCTGEFETFEKAEACIKAYAQRPRKKIEVVAEYEIIKEK